MSKSARKWSCLLAKSKGGVGGSAFASSSENPLGGVDAKEEEEAGQGEEAPPPPPPKGESKPEKERDVPWLALRCRCKRTGEEREGVVGSSHVAVSGRIGINWKKSEFGRGSNDDQRFEGEK